MLPETNIDFWQKMLENPTPSFQKMFDTEKEFLIANISSDSDVMDLGCGTGRNTTTIITKTIHVLGVDSDILAVNEFNNKFRHSADVYAMQGSAHDLCCKDNLFDVVVSFDLLPNLSELKTLFFIETARILKKGGKLLLSTYAETALVSRLKMYEKVEAPIHSIDDDGKIVFRTVSGDITSEQFSLVQLEAFGNEVGLRMISSQKVEDLAYLVVFQK